MYVQDTNGTINATFLSPIVGNANSSPPTFRKRRQSTNPPPHRHPSSAAAAARSGHIKGEGGSLSPHSLANAPSAVGPELADRRRVAGRHHSSRATSDTCRKNPNNDGIMPDKRNDRLLSIDVRDVVQGSGSREDAMKKALHVDRDVEMRSPHDNPDINNTNNIISSEPLAHHPHRYSSHSYHSSSSSSLRHDEVRAVKKMRIEVDSSSSSSSSSSMMMKMKNQGGRESPLSGRLTVGSQP